MKTILNKRILLSLGMIVFVGAAALGATGAFFSDTETSTGNTFTAGAIDLKVDSTQHYNGMICEPNTGVGAVVGTYWWRHVGSSAPAAYPVEFSACGGSWVATDLGATNNKFFNFGDIKPGDSGEDTISLHVLNNDAYVCATVSNITNADNSTTGPESVAAGNTLNGDLQKTMVWKVWKDDGAGSGVACDNIQNGTEQTLTSGHPTNGTLALYDSQTSHGPLAGGSTSCIGVSWSLPAESGNETQTDSMTGDISFNVVQSRNNANFKCSDVTNPGVQGTKVGANFSSYSAPTCTTTVQSGTPIQTAIDSAAAGSTVCVANGTYTGPIEVNKGITLASLNGPSVTTIAGGVKITSSDVTVKGFTVNAGVVSGEPLPVGFYVASGSNITINSNDINGVSNSHGVLFPVGAAYTNVAVTNNKIHNNNAGIYTNPHTGNLAINNNDIYDNNAGIGGVMGATVQYNQFTGASASGEAMGVDSTYNSGSTVISYNNFLNGWKINTYTSGTVTAENNFFNFTGTTQETGETVDFTPETASQYAHN